MAESMFKKNETVWYCKDKVYEAEIKAVHYDDEIPYYTIYIPLIKVEKQTIQNRLFKKDNLFEAIKHVL